MLIGVYRSGYVYMANQVFNSFSFILHLMAQEILQLHVLHVAHLATYARLVLRLIAAGSSIHAKLKDATSLRT